MRNKMVFFLAVSFGFVLVSGASAFAPFEHHQSPGTISTQGHVGGF
ncbi:hypothetical protein [Paenibacillus polymyxa]|nr:hypothetical protein [Paenibacillus polymyxa]